MLLNWADKKQSSIMYRVHEQLRKHNIEMLFNESSIHIADGRYFSSVHKNKLPMKPDDKRIAKLGRNYLETNELTVDQFKVVNSIFKGLFDAKLLTSIITDDGEPVADTKWYGFKRSVKQEPIKGDY